jgi:hypothetical protein
MIGNAEIFTDRDCRSIKPDHYPETIMAQDAITVYIDRYALGNLYAVSLCLNNTDG